MFGMFSSVIFATTFVVACSQKCKSFDDLTVQVQDGNGANATQEVNGCIEGKQFGYGIVQKVFVVGQKIRTLGRDSLTSNWNRNLEQISISKCEDLREIEPMSFRNLPRLKILEISDNPELTSFPKVFDAVPNLQLLKINDNQLNSIATHAFANLAKLKELYAESNNLEHWNADWFENNDDLTVINFEDNGIRVVTGKAFEKLAKLREIFLDGNKIEAIQRDAFVGLEALEYLGLSHNKLTEINENVFPNGLNIETLDVSFNRLNYLSNEALGKISAQELILDRNPWKCACLDRIHYWMRGNDATLTDSGTCNDTSLPACVMPKMFSQSCLEHVDDELTERYLKKLNAAGARCTRSD